MTSGPFVPAPAELARGRARQQQMNLHLLANPGDSLLLQHTLDRLTRCLYPSLRVFHVSERASSFRTPTRICPGAGKGQFGVAPPVFPCNFQ